MKKKLLLFSLLWGCLLPSFGQETFKIDDFSDKYYGKVFISDKSKPYCGGWVAVFDRKTNKELIRVDADELSYELHDNRMKANIAEGPYGEHSVLFYGDFNFDGVKDFALMDGLHGWNHTPSFKIYLASGKGFKFSPEFSRLTHENCGIFTVDEENNTVKTLTRGAGAWSEVSTYIIQDNKPILVNLRKEDSSAPLYFTTIQNFEGDKMVETNSTTIKLYDDNVTEAFTFYVDSKMKTIILYSLDDQTLHYAITNVEGLVEFYYPKIAANKQTDFSYFSKSNTLKFRTKDAEYAITDTSGNLGISITTKGKTYRWKGNTEVREGSLAALLKKTYNNVTKIR